MTTSGPDFVGSPATGPGIHAEPDDREEVYFQGSPPVRATFGKLSLYIVIALALFSLAGLLIHKAWGPWWITAIIIVIGLAVPWIPSFLARSIRYRITNYRIDYERGLFAKNIDTLELWHVEDLEFHQSLLDRIQNLGTITVISKDEKMPTLVIWGLPNPRPLYETLKQRVIAVKRQRGVIKMDPG
jgi:membrane protein YdbS with pleckstrin-like domain